MTLPFARQFLNVEVRPTIVLARSPSTRKDRCCEPGKHERVELFLPYDEVQYGNIGVWHPVHGHFEAQINYYWETIPPYAFAEEAERMIEQYRALLAALQEPYDLQVRKKMPHDWRKVAWRR